MIEVQNFCFAALLVQCGHWCCSCWVEGNDTTWKFTGVSQTAVDDWFEAFQNPEQLVSIQGFISAMNIVSSIQRKARQSRDGVWTDPKWIAG
jgi:hypothetical protein